MKRKFFYIISELLLILTMIFLEAFIHCDAILEVFYTGSLEEWSSMEMNENVNCFARASFVFDYVADT